MGRSLTKHTNEIVSRAFNDLHSQYFKCNRQSKLDFVSFWRNHGKVRGNSTREYVESESL